MINLTELDSIIQQAKRSAEEAAGSDCAKSHSAALTADYTLLQGDNNAAMRMLLGSDRGAFSCIYLDPPFLTGADYQASVRIRSEKLGENLTVKVPAYEDNWKKDPAAYYRMLAENIAHARELLSESGLFCLHLDWHSVHYARVMLDAIFGEERFLNEIIWQYKSGGSTTRHFGRKHDTILVYAKSPAYKIHIGKEKSYNRGFKPYHFKGVEEFEDETGWYTLVNAKDVWQIDMVGRTSAERTGYATQKPLALMERIIRASSDEGDLVGDFCCGSGSFIEAAARLGRRAVGCDASGLAMALTEKRLHEAGFTCERRNILPAEEMPGQRETAGADRIPAGLAPRERQVLEKIAREDPAALVLFEAAGPDGQKRVLDVFGNEMTENDRKTGGQSDGILQLGCRQ